MALESPTTVCIVAPDEQMEAVIISGPRKGDIITLLGTEPQWSAEEKRMLEAAVEAARGAAESATRLTAEMEGLLEDLRRIRTK